MLGDLFPVKSNWRRTEFRTAAGASTKWASVDKILSVAVLPTKPSTG